MVLFVLRKPILQTRIRSHPVGLNVWFLVGHFVYFHTFCVRTAKALARLRGCAGSPEHSLAAYVIHVSTIISRAGSFWENLLQFSIKTYAVLINYSSQSKPMLFSSEWVCFYGNVDTVFVLFKISSTTTFIYKEKKKNMEYFLSVIIRYPPSLFICLNWK